MKVYCEDCKYYNPAPSSPVLPPHPPRCWYPSNIHFDREKNNDYPEKLQGSILYLAYIDDVYDFLEKPWKINKNHDCDWFKMESPAWYEIKLRKRIKKRYG